jgi:hypothetical protein
MDKKQRRARRRVRGQTKYKLPSVTEVAEVLRLAPAIQPWRYEAPVRAVIRASLCLQSAPWPRADRMAFVLVARP